MTLAPDSVIGIMLVDSLQAPVVDLTRFRGLALALLSGAAWVQWTAEPEPDLEGKVVLLQGDAEDIEKIIWKTDKEEAVLEQRRDERGPYVWVTHTRWEEKKKPEDPAAPPTPEGEKPEGEKPEGDKPEDAAAVNASKATLLAHSKEVRDDGSIVEVVI